MFLSEEERRRERGGGGEKWRSRTCAPDPREQLSPDTGLRINTLLSKIIKGAQCFVLSRGLIFPGAPSTPAENGGTPHNAYLPVDALAERGTGWQVAKTHRR